MIFHLIALLLWAILFIMIFYQIAYGRSILSVLSPEAAKEYTVK